MPSNKQQVTEMECRRNINLILTKGITHSRSINYKDVILEATLNYSVSDNFVKRFIKEYYLDTGKVNLKDGALTLTKQ